MDLLNPPWHANPMNRRRALFLVASLSAASVAQAASFDTRTWTQRSMDESGAGHLTDFLGGPPVNPDVKILSQAEHALRDFKTQVSVADDFLKKAVGALIFPDIKNGGAFVGASRGDGVLVVAGRPQGFYRQQSGSLGLQLGVQRYSQIYIFLQPHALKSFIENPETWSGSVDGTVAVPYVGMKDSFVDSGQLNQPVAVFTFNNHGLMAGVSLGATQIFPRRSK